MEQVPIEDLYTGQILSEAVFDAEGNEICPAGQIIGEADRERLRKARVRTVSVHMGLYREADIQVRRTAIELRFGGVKDPVLLTFKRLVLERLNLMKV
jgi:hypothetical protein